MVDVEYGQHVVVGSPFTCKVFDLSKVLILHDQQLGSSLQEDELGDVIFYGLFLFHVCNNYLAYLQSK